MSGVFPGNSWEMFWKPDADENRGFGKGEVEGLAAGAFGGGAVGFLALAAVGWRFGGLGALGKVVGKS